MKRVLLALSCALMSCNVPIPNASVYKGRGGVVTEMTGVIEGHRSGDSPISMRSADTGLTCSGATNAQGLGEMTCSNGYVIPIHVPPELYGKMSGAYVATLPDGTVYATGWGHDADLRALRTKLGL